ncbi:MAG: hypothetical protein KME45_01045 [Stenomitos rutilans HA7619-LM2]|nr:hypothetical protein [Stenomitos rutilans HA7619-LM2]
MGVELSTPSKFINLLARNELNGLAPAEAECPLRYECDPKSIWIERSAQVLRLL